MPRRVNNLRFRCDNNLTPTCWHSFPTADILILVGCHQRIEYVSDIGAFRIEAHSCCYGHGTYEACLRWVALLDRASDVHLITVIARRVSVQQAYSSILNICRFSNGCAISDWIWCFILKARLAQTLSIFRPCDDMEEHVGIVFIRKPLSTSLGNGL